jgi:Family of unknown function (DUF6600)/FecR protein
MKTGKFLAAVLFAVTMLVSGAWAQDYENGQSGNAAPASDGQGPQLAQNYPQGPNGEAAPRSEGPAPVVARISLIHGDVSTARGDTSEWSSTTVNAPLVQGDQVATGERARAEIQLDFANLLRLAARSQAKIADLTRTRIQVQVAQGYASYTVAKGNEADVEIDSPNVAVRPLRPGRYRLQVVSDAETNVIVRDGEAEITTPQGSTRVRSGEMIVVRGTDQPEYKVSSAPGNDDWDRWNNDRDNVIRDAESWGHTNRYYTGANDLDAYGHWVYVPGYGNVWQPYQEATWAPYQTGRWVWEPYYGWTWVSYEPWGWAPYHYGRWFYYGSSWCWWPGPVYVHYRPLWSPAFVFFVGFGHHSGFGFGSIGWFPVGPHDPYYPWYGRGFNRVNVVNITNINVINVHGRGRGDFIAPLAVRGRQPYYSNANLALTNPHVRGSITSVSSENFGRSGHEGWRHGVEEHELRESKVMTANLPVVPSRESLHAGRGEGAAPAGIQTRNNDRFFTKHQPPAAPESFHTQVQRVQRVVGPEAADAGSRPSGVQGNVRTDVHAGPAQVDRHDIGGNAAGNVKTGIAQVPRTDGPGAGASGGSNASNNAAQDNRRGDHGGWSKFGPPSGRSNSEAGSGHSDQTPSGRFPIGGDRQSNDRQINDRQTNDRQTNDRQINDRSVGGGQTPQPSDRGAAQPPRTQDSGGWQKFPSNSDRGASSPSNRGNDRVGQGGSKPPLDLHRPIVTPRQSDNSNDSRGNNRGNDSRYSPPPQRTPEVHNEPRYNPPPSSRNDRSYSPPSHNDRSYSPPSHSDRSYSPPSRSESRSSGGGGGSSSHSSGGSSSSHSSGGGGHSDSKSSSNPKHR